MTHSETFDCFLCHNTRDKPAVRALTQALKERGISVWLDEEQLTPGWRWQPLVEAGIRGSRCVAVLVGADGLGPWQSEELEAALTRAVETGRPVIPVLLADAPAVPELPLFLAGRTWVDLRPGADIGRWSGLDRLIWGIQGRHPADSSSSRPPEPGGPKGDPVQPSPLLDKLRQQQQDEWDNCFQPFSGKRDE
jgi:hypothetical protein